MPANVETMFYVREKPWHGLGTEVQEAPTSADALIYAGLDWEVIQKNVYTEDGSLIAGYKVNTRSTDDVPLGIVSDRYKVVQNEDAFQFTDDLLGAGVTYETAGALQGGRKVWMLARMPHRYIIGGDEIAPYMVVMNSHDGSSGIKVAMTPIRVVCQNTLTCFRIPCQLILHPRFKHLSTDAKLLYRILLNRMSLSIKNEWYDDGSAAHLLRQAPPCGGLAHSSRSVCHADVPLACLRHRAQISSRDGMAGIAPRFVVLSAPAALAKRTISSSSPSAGLNLQSINLESTAPVKVSPAPVVSTTSTANPGT